MEKPNSLSLTTQEALPVKIKGLVFINATSIMDQILGLIKPFMKKELVGLVGIDGVPGKSLSVAMPVYWSLH